MKLITNTIICLIIVFASNLLNTGTVFAAEDEQGTIVAIPSSGPFDKDTIYTPN